MRGTILGVHDGRGVLLGPNDQRIEFPLSEWRSPGMPAAGQIVDFVEEGGQARGVFAVPGLAGVGRQSNSLVLGWISVACLALGFLIPLIPHIAAFVLGVIGAAQARTENDDTALMLSRIGWIGSLVMMVIGFLAVLAIFVLLGAGFFSAAWHGLGPVDF
jgi:hypothetical protein